MKRARRTSSAAAARTEGSSGKQLTVLTRRPALPRGFRSLGPARPKPAPGIRPAEAAGGREARVGPGGSGWKDAGRVGGVPGRHGGRGRPAPGLRRKWRSAPAEHSSLPQAQLVASPLSNYGMHLTGRGHRLSSGQHHLSCPARSGASPLPAGDAYRYVAKPHNANCFFLGNFGSAGGERAVAPSTAGAVSFASPLSAFQLPLAR